MHRNMPRAACASGLPYDRTYNARGGASIRQKKNQTVLELPYDRTYNARGVAHAVKRVKRAAHLRRSMHVLKRLTT
jgi:hypothetical protein